MMANTLSGGAGQVVLKLSSPHANLVPIPTRHNQLVLSVKFSLFDAQLHMLTG